MDSWLPARDLVAAALDKRFQVDESGRVLCFEQGGMPWMKSTLSVSRCTARARFQTKSARLSLSLSLSPKTDEKGARTSLIRLTRVSFWFGASLFLSLFSCLLCGFILDSLFLSLSQWEEMRERGVGGDLGREIAG